DRRQASLLLDLEHAVDLARAPVVSLAHVQHRTLHRVVGPVRRTPRAPPDGKPACSWTSSTRWILRGPQWCRSRTSSTARSTALSVLSGERFGRRGRSCTPPA